MFLHYIKRSSGTTLAGRPLDVTPSVRSRLATRMRPGVVGAPRGDDGR
jgi:hypothetical protein